MMTNTTAMDNNDEQPKKNNKRQKKSFFLSLFVMVIHIVCSLLFQSLSDFLLKHGILCLNYKFVCLNSKFCIETWKYAFFCHCSSSWLFILVVCYYFSFLLKFFIWIQNFELKLEKNEFFCHCLSSWLFILIVRHDFKLKHEILCLNLKFSVFSWNFLFTFEILNWISKLFSSNSKFEISNLNKEFCVQMQKQTHILNSNIKFQVST